MTHEWQPIDTAPRDGTCVLLYFSDLDGSHRIDAMWRAPNIVVGRFGNGWVSDIADAELWEEGCIVREAVGVYATHWMPLPAIPTPEAAPAR